MQQSSGQKYKELSQADIENLIKWITRTEKRGKSPLNSIFIHAYKLRPFRPTLRKFILKIEGGMFFTRTLRDIFEKYHNIKIGMYTYGGAFNPTIFYPAKVVIGNYCTIGSIMSVHRRNHPIQRVSTHPLFYSEHYTAHKNDYLDIPRDNPLNIGHDVWIGRNSIILPGCETIGNGAVIGAGAVVTKNVEPYTIIVGNPAKVLRKRYSKDIEEKIIKSKWWLQSLSSLADKMPCFINDPSLDLFNRFNF